MPSQLYLGTVAGIEVRMRWAAAALLTALGAVLAFGTLPQAHPGRPTGAYVLTAMSTVVLIAGSLLAHELAHAAVSRIQGTPVQRISLWVLGGLTGTRGGAATPRAEFLVALAGPAASLMLAAVFGGCAAMLGAVAPGLPATMAGQLAAVNLAVAVLHLIPVAPLDGGRILRAAVWRASGDPATGTRAACRAGQALGITLVTVGGILAVTGALDGLGLLLLGVFLTQAVVAEQTVAELGQRLHGMTAADVMTPNPVTAVPSAWLASFIDTTVLQRPFSTYPLVDLDGRLAGLVTLNRIRAVSPDRRWWTRLSDIAIAPQDVVTATPDEPLADLITRIGDRTGDNRAIVINDRGQVIGVISPRDLARAAILAELSTATATTSAGNHGPQRHRDDHPINKDRLLPA